jgi:hypothetical protein
MNELAIVTQALHKHFGELRAVDVRDGVQSVRFVVVMRYLYQFSASVASVPCLEPSQQLCNRLCMRIAKVARPEDGLMVLGNRLDCRQSNGSASGCGDRESRLRDRRQHDLHIRPLGKRSGIRLACRVSWINGTSALALALTVPSASTDTQRSLTKTEPNPFRLAV